MLKSATYISSVLLFIVSLLACESLSQSVDRLEVNSGSDTTYLPLRFTIIHKADSRADAKVQYHPRLLLSGSSENGDTVLYLNSYNPPLNDPGPSIFGLRTYPGDRVVDDDPVRMVCNDCGVYSDAAAKRRAVASAGYRNDSAWVFRLFPETDSIEFRFLTSGKDGTGDGHWEPDIRLLLLEDYDYDGLTEAFFYVNSGREDGPKRLFCVQMEDLIVEWELEVSASMGNSASFMSLRDSLNPAVAFICGRHMQGYRDVNFSDYFGYFAIVGRHGELTLNRIAKVQAGPFSLARSERPDCFYIIHNADFIEADDSVTIAGIPSMIGTDQVGTKISKIDRQGNIIATTTPHVQPRNVWLQSYKDNKGACVYVRCETGIIQVYGTSLRLLAESGPSSARSMLGPISIRGFSQCNVFEDGIYTNDMTKILHFPQTANYFQVLEVDSAGNAIALIIGAGSSYTFGRIEQKSVIDLMSAFYLSNQSYILTALAATLAGLLSMFYYSHRVKSNLQVISEQKDELESTHQALKKAQATIVAHEKFRQAQDIAGGFAHEIRNDLFPARSALSKLMKAEDSQVRDADWVRRLSVFSDKAVARAIELTQLISQYTRIEENREPEAVPISDVLKSVLETNRIAGEELGCNIENSCPNGVHILANCDQIYIVLNNLLLNALHAVAGIGNARIKIAGQVNGTYLKLMISDNGPGIAEIDREKVFEMFYSTKPTEGVGLGLSMVRKIIEMYGGAITVDKDTELGGARFVMNFRIHPEDQTID